MANLLANMNRMDQATIDGLARSIATAASDIAFMVSSSTLSDEKRWIRIQSAIAQINTDFPLLDLVTNGKFDGRTINVHAIDSNKG